MKTCGFLVLACLGFNLPAAAEWDLVILNGQVADGSGAPLKVQQVAVQNGRIAALGASVGAAKKSIDAAGKVVAPGFIDVHAHAETLPSLPVSENFLRMGVTTIVTGNCGTSETDVAAFFGKCEAAGLGLNVATLIGHNAIRREAMGGSFLRRPTETQMQRMRDLVDQAMRDGAVGLSTGLIYTPGTFAKTDEILELAKAAARHDGIYVSHMRYETTRILEAIAELVEIARGAGIRAHVSHLKLSGPTAWGRAEEVLRALDQARAEGLRLTHDQYAYTASSTGLSQLIPSAAREGGMEAYRERLMDPERKQTIKKEMRENRQRMGYEDYHYAVVARYKADPELVGKSLREAALLRRGSASLEDQEELILEIEDKGGGSAVYHSMNEDDLRRFMAHPLTMTASDGGPRRFGEDMPHPRSYGNNARVLGRYVRELGHLKLEDALRRMTSLPAETFQLKDRGVIREGAVADLVIFDPAQVIDKATFDEPHHYAEGFSEVIVNGVPVIEAGVLTPERPGRAVKRGK